MYELEEKEKEEVNGTYYVVVIKTDIGFLPIIDDGCQMEVYSDREEADYQCGFLAGSGGAPVGTYEIKAVKMQITKTEK